MKIALATLVIAFGVVIHFANNRIQELQRRVTTLQQDNRDLQQSCSPAISRPMEAPNGSN